MWSISFLRMAGVLAGLYIVVSAFYGFRAHRIHRGDTALRWLIGGGLIVVCLFPDSINFLRDLLALESHTHGRLLALLVVSNLLIWLLFLRQRGKTYMLARQLDGLVRSTVVPREAAGGYENLPAGVDILVVLPAYNEAENLPGVLARMPREIDGNTVGVVVVDDGSEDRTREVALAAGAGVVSNPVRRGQGAASRLGYDLAQRVGAKVVVTHDADGQHSPEEIANVVGPILADEKDFVIGSRILGEREEDSQVRLLGIHVNNLLINFLAGTDVSDCSSGFKAIRVESLKKIDLAEDQFQAAEAIIAAAKNGLRIGEAPISVKRRWMGESKKGRNLSYGLNFTRTVLKAWWR
jgi:hypothetical protein